jgi:hypothetical protein
MKSRLIVVLTLVSVVALLAVGQAVAQNAPAHHFHIAVVPRAHQQSEGVVSDAVPANLYALSAVFAASPLVVDPTAANADGTDLWPCFGGPTTITSSTGSTAYSYNPDCQYVGDPRTTLVAGGAVLGSPAYLWSLATCNATSTSAGDCAQSETFYEDDSNDTADDLTYELEATQGGTVLLDTGVIDFCGGCGNPYGGATPPADVVIYGDTNLGDMGESGENNGNCLASFGPYPVTADPPLYEYGISANKTCGTAAAGVVDFTATTEIATPSYKEETKAADCPQGGPPCWTVKLTSKYKISQKWSIYLQ